MFNKTIHIVKNLQHLFTTSLVVLALLLWSNVGLAQTEILLNGDFSSWDDANTPTSWSSWPSISKESTIFRSAPFSLKQLGGTASTQKISQEVSVIGGRSYTISFWYYVESGDATDARIWSNWKAGGTKLTDNADVLASDDYLPSAASWQNFSLTLTAPATADKFYYEVRTYKNAVVYWDDMSFILQPEGSSSIGENSVNKFNTYPNPFTNTINIHNAENVSQVLVANLVGAQQVMDVTFSGNNAAKINTNELPSGIYLVTIVNKQGQQTVRKMIKK